MAVPKLLLLSDVAPDPDGGGGSVYLDAIVSEFAPGDLCFGLIGAESKGEEAPHISTLTVATPPAKGVGARLPASIRPVYRRLFETVVDHTVLPRLARRLARFGREQGAELVWATLSSPHVLRLAMPVARQLGVSLVVTVWDPPGYKLPRFGIRGRLLRRHLAIFGATLRAAKCCAVMSPGMKLRYEQEFATPCVVMNHGPEESDWRPPQRAPASPSRLRVGFAGSLYARREFEAMIAALASVDWRLAGRDISLHLLTSQEDAASLGEVDGRVECLGWQDFQTTLAALSECDLCYLPYWMDEGYSEVVQLAFPTKLSLYLASGRPVLFHGPRDSSPARFLDEFPAGVCCHSLEAEQILDVLRDFLTAGERYAEATSAGQSALREVLGRDVFRRRLARILEAGTT